MKKRGQITWNMLVYAALALLVLVFVGIIFSNTVRDQVKAMLSIGSEATQAAEGEKCQSLFSGQVCKETCEEGYIQVSGSFEDCAAPKTVCCRPT